MAVPGVRLPQCLTEENAVLQTLQPQVRAMINMIWFFSRLILIIGLILAKPVMANDVFKMPAGLKSLEFVEVENPGNKPDKNGLGAVNYTFKIGKYEVTTAQYVEFLNAKAKATGDGSLWNNDMDKTRSGEGARCEIRRLGEPGNFQYSVAGNYSNRPVSHVSFLDACRFCNWLHNGQGNGDTETGAYDLKGYDNTDGRPIRRNPNARFFVPNEDEWYKAAYFDKAKPGGPGYWRFPTRSNQKPDTNSANANSANFFLDKYLLPDFYFSEVGSFKLSQGPSGTFDMAGNVHEWTEGLTPPFLRSLRGGAFDTADAGENITLVNTMYTSRSDVPSVGFRVAARVGEEPLPLMLSQPAVLGQGGSVITDFPRRPWRDPANGKPFFPLAWFSYASNGAELDQMAAEGCNLVLFVNSPSDVDTDEQTRANSVAMRKYLDHAARVGMKVLIQTGGFFGAHIRADKAEIARQRQWLESIAGHPAILGFQLYDEPEYRTGGGLSVEEKKRVAEFVDGLRQTRAMIQEINPNPNLMISVVFNLVPLSSWTEFLPVIDSFQVDRYPLDRDQAFFGHRGDWGPLMMAWSMHHGAQALKTHPNLKNPSPCMQGVGSNHIESSTLGIWRNPLYEETRYMAYSSMTVGSWGVFHWIRSFGRPDSTEIIKNVSRLYREIHTLMPALEKSYEKPPFTVRHNHESITRGFLTDSIADITTLGLEDDLNYYLIVSNNSGTFNDVTLRLKIPGLTDTRPRSASVLNESWSRNLSYSEDSSEWLLDTHTMCFGDINIWVIPKKVAENQ